MLTPALTGQPSAPRLGTTQPAGWLDMRAEPMAGQAQGQPEGHLGNPSPKLGERVLQATWGQAASSTLHPKLGISHLCAPIPFCPARSVKPAGSSICSEVAWVLERVGMS